MKRRISLLLFATICFSVASHSQSYIEETKGIIKFSTLIRQLHGNISQVSVNPSTGEVVINDPSLDKTLKTITEKVKVTELKNSPNNDSFNDPGTNPSSPTPGSISQNPNRSTNPNRNQPDPSMSRIPKDSSSTDIIALNNSLASKQKLDNEVYIELKYLAFLVYNAVPTDYLDNNLSEAFPRHFMYLEKILAEMAVYIKSVPQGEGQATGAGSSFAFSETAIIYGITDWAIKRAKEELINVYLDDWYNKLKNQDLIVPLIPQSLKVYEAFKADEALNLAKYGDKWKAAFQEDIRNIPVVFQDENYVTKVLTKLGLTVGDKLFDELVPIIAGGDEIVYNLYLKKHLVTVVSNMAGKYNLGTTANFPVFKRCVIMADLLTRACGEMDEAKNVYKAVTLNDIKQMDIGSWKIFFKLVLLRDKLSLNHVFDEQAPTFIADFVFKNNTVPIGKISHLIEESITIVASYQNILSNIKIASSEISFGDVRKLFDLFVQLNDNVSGYIELGRNGSNGVVTYKEKIKPFLTYLSEVGEGLLTKQYGKVLDGTISILKQADDLKDPEKATFSNVVEYMQRYGSFMVNIISAKEPGDVETALDELVPKNLYQLKNQKNFTVSASVFPGVFGGLERIKKYQTDNNGNALTNSPKTSSTKGSLAFYLPIGLDFNFGRETQKSSVNMKRYASHSIMVQIFDLGAVLNYRLSGSDEETEQSEPDLTFQQLFSPVPITCFILQIHQ
jgi:hypothetical protein